MQIARCGPAERAEQAALFNACFKKAVDAAGLAWRYDQSPHGASLSLLSRTEQGQAVSGYACSPRLVVPGGERLRAALAGQTGDVMTHPQWRQRGLFSALDAAALRATQELGWPCLFGLPNQRSAHIFLALGWREVGRVRAHTHLLALGAAGRAERAREGRLARWLAPLGARRGARARVALQRGAAGQLRELSAFPLEVERLSAAVEPRFAWMVRRDAEWLDWRFLKNPAGLHRALGVFAAGGALTAYAIVQLPRPGTARGWLVDALARDQAALDAALSGALQHLASAGATAVEATAIDGSWWAGVLARAGFLPPRRGRELSVILYVHDPQHPLARAGQDASRWYFTDGDRDDETMG